MEVPDVEEATSNLRTPAEDEDLPDEKNIISKRSKQHKNKRLKSSRQVRDAIQCTAKFLRAAQTKIVRVLQGCLGRTFLGSNL